MTTHIKSIDVSGLNRLIEEGADLKVIDVRTEEEYQEVHAHVASLLVLDQINPETISKVKAAKDTAIFFICRSGVRSLSAAQMFAKEGFTDLTNVTGGTNAWLEMGFPVSRGLSENDYEIN